MSEKLYALLLRLYPSRFREKYAEDARQLYRDRFRNEKGLFRRARLCWDLVADMVVGLPQAYRNSYTAASTTSLSANGDWVPSFQALNKEPLPPGFIFLGSVLAFTVLFSFSFAMSRPVLSGQRSPSNSRQSPIEAVIRSLNQPISPDSIGENPRGSAASASSTAAGPQRKFDSTVGSASISAEMPTRRNTVEAAGNLAEGTLNAKRFHLDLEQTTRPAASSSIHGTQARPAVSNVSAIAERLRSGLTTPTPAPNAGYSTLVSPAEPQPENAYNAMARLIKTHDVVMFGEVHDSEQEYDWLCKLVKTPGFSDRVDDIVVEFGNARYQKTVDRYVAGEDVPFDEVQNAFRNMVADVEPVSPVYGRLYRAVREANLEHPGQHGIRLLMGSPPGDWNKIKTSADLAPFEAERERWYAQVVEKEVLAKHRRALLIMGAWHFLRGRDQVLQDELAVQEHRTPPAAVKSRLGPGFLEQQFLAAGADPYLVVFGTNVVNNRGGIDKRFDAWHAPVIVPLSGNWVGALPAQPVITGGHAPAIPLTLADQADAILYVAPCSVLQTVYLSHAELDNTPYGQEMIRRNIIELGHPVSFQYGRQPQCIQAEPSAH
jgi:hypothetical protein